MKMVSLISPILLMGGIALMIFGLNATHSFGSELSRLFTGAPTDKAMWMLMGGAVAFLVGLTLAWRYRKTT